MFSIQERTVTKHDRTICLWQNPINPTHKSVKMVFLRESKDVQKQWMIESVLQSHYP